jgi:hypothetical protein
MSIFPVENFSSKILDELPSLRIPPAFQREYVPEAEFLDVTVTRF